MKTKTLLELLKKHGVHIYDNDEALISEVETEYKNQFSQLPTSVTDKDIERMTEAEFPTTNSIYDRVQEKRIVYAKGLKDMRSLNHTPVMGEGWMSVEDLPEEEGEFLCVQFRNGDIDYSGSIIMVCSYHYGFFESSETGDAFHPTHYHTLPPPPHQANT
jgi:hypothetical protein